MKRLGSIPEESNEDDSQSGPQSGEITSVMVNKNDLQVDRPSKREDLHAKIVDTHGGVSYGKVRGIIAQGGDV